MVLNFSIRNGKRWFHHCMNVDIYYGMDWLFYYDSSFCSGQRMRLCDTNPINAKKRFFVHACTVNSGIMATKILNIRKYSQTVQLPKNSIDQHPHCPIRIRTSSQISHNPIVILRTRFAPTRASGKILHFLIFQYLI